MTPKNTADPEENPLGVLDDAASVDTAGIGILGGTAQVSVSLPTEEDDDLADDGVVDGEVVGDLIIDESSVAALPRIDPPSTVKPAASGAAKTRPAPTPSAAAPVSATAAKSKAAGAKRPAKPVTIAAPTPSAPVEEPVLDAEPLKTRDVVSSRAASEKAEGVVVAEIAEDHGEEQTAAERFLARASADAAKQTTALPARTAVEKENRPMSTPEEKKPVSSTPVRATVRTDVTLTSKRLDDLGDASRESADLLTADRLLDPHRVAKPEPEGAWSHFLYTVSGRRINIGDGRRARERKALSARIAAPLAGGARFVPVLSRKGGVGKTTVTALLGMALADAREDRVIAVDANPDRGTLAERIVRPHHNKSVRDLVRIHDDVKGYHDISAIVARDATRLDVLASDADPRIAEAFSDSDYRDVADVAAHYYSLVLTDTGTGIVHSVMSATLDLADQIVIVSGLSVDEARLASETLTWLETNGYAEQARDAIVVLNQSAPGTPLVRLNELQAHFATRARSVVRVPYDPQIAGGGTIVFANLLPETRVAARELAALLVEGLRARAA